MDSSNKKPKNYRPYYHSRRKQDPISMGDALSELTKRMRLDNKIVEVQVLKVWEESMGKFIFDKTTKIKLYKSDLTIYVNSGVLRNELQMNERGIIELLNRKLGPEAITRVIIR